MRRDGVRRCFIDSAFATTRTPAPAAAVSRLHRLCERLIDFEGDKLIYVARTRNGTRHACAAVQEVADNHLRHSKFVDLREDEKAKDVVRESLGS